jgi:hypothetical protein
MPRIKPVQTKINHWYLLVSFTGSFIFIFAGSELVKLLFNTIEESYMPLWLIMLITLTGGATQYYGLVKTGQNRAYIQWDNQKIEYILPGQKKRNTILLSDLKEIEVKVFHIIFYFQNGGKTILNLENFLYKDLQTVKEGMQALGENLGKKPALHH